MRADLIILFFAILVLLHLFEMTTESKSCYRGVSIPVSFSKKLNLFYLNLTF